jgi:hypothetical protein
LNPIEKTVVNTNWDLFFEKKKKTYYVLVNTTWLTSTALAGPWTATKTLPKDMAKLPAGQNWDDVKKMVAATGIVCSGAQGLLQQPACRAGSGEGRACVFTNSREALALRDEHRERCLSG